MLDVLLLLLELWSTSCIWLVYLILSSDLVMVVISMVAISMVVISMAVISMVVWIPPTTIGVVYS